MKRLAYIDWMRGLACAVMFQTHCYDSWLTPEARKSTLFAWSQLGGTLPAPLFIFLAGISVAVVTEKLREKVVRRNEVAKQVILRGAEVFGLAMLFRVQEFALGYGYAPWTDLLRVGSLLEQRIRTFPVSDLGKQVPGRDYPYETMFEGIVQHTIYHAGQIAMIRSMLRSQS